MAEGQEAAARDRRRYRIAADIGGTFTDIAFLSEEGVLATRKLPSTPDDYARAVVTGILDLLAELRTSPAEVSAVLHGCTVATNAILEGKGAPTALITTQGFRDVLELRRIRVPRLYDPLWVKPEPLVPRERRFELAERIAADGSVVRPVEAAEVDAVVERVGRAGVEAVAVCFLHSYANPAHERLVGERLRRALPGVFVSLSTDILPEFREYERTSTTVINAYVGPPVTAYVGSLVEAMSAAGIGGRLLVMQSSGGMLDSATVMERPAYIVECGPAAGVMGAAYLGRLIGCANLITLDMGGTTAKASIIEDHQLLKTDEYEVGGGISLSSRLVKGAGYALKTPVIDISEVGAGGGSIVWLDKSGQIKVGPRSAGAVPGPVCYGLGGSEPTVTDANVVLGYLNPGALAGGTVAIDAEKARRTIAERVAAPLGQTLFEAAYGVHVIANANMMRAVKAVSTYRGRDPAEFVLLAFGGNGGVHGVELARALRMQRVIVPIGAGVFSAIGLLVAEVRFDQSRAFLRHLSALSPAEIEAAFAPLEEQVLAKLARPRAEVSFERAMDLRYAGQAFELTVAVPEGLIARDGTAGLAELFEREHERTYGHRFPDAKAIETVAVRVAGIARGAGGGERPAALRYGATAGAARPASRSVYFGPELGHLETPIVSRGALAGGRHEGPLVIEEYEGTVLVPPGARVSLDGFGNAVIDLGTSG
ncbi:MAG: hydantoinase/oxoprolinase family protein [Proteobacteria bacterium]|nr:hydantoinase/oxoprolinase family protein [Pseudomonadota bacterium]